MVEKRNGRGRATPRTAGRSCTSKRQSLQTTLRRGWLPCNDERKALVALVIKPQTTVPLDWIAQKLHMGTVSRVTGVLSKRLATDRKLNKCHRQIIEGVTE